MSLLKTKQFKQYHSELDLTETMTFAIPGKTLSQLETLLGDGFEAASIQLNSACDQIGVPLVNDQTFIRFAPSVLTRSENILFGTSATRFAIRVYLDLETGSFVNL